MDEIELKKLRELNAKISSNEIDEKDFKQHFQLEDHSENIYKGCCNYSTDRRLLILGTQIGLSGAMLCFSATMLATGDDDGGIYMSMISSILAFWMGKSNDFEKK
jgi:hypothetical protein